MLPLCVPCSRTAITELDIQTQRRHALNQRVHICTSAPCTHTEREREGAARLTTTLISFTTTLSLRLHPGRQPRTPRQLSVSASVVSRALRSGRTRPTCVRSDLAINATPCALFCFFFFLSLSHSSRVASLTAGDETVGHWIGENLAQSAAI